ncbi:MAG: PAS domain-containing protein [Bacteroidota bacterium]|nr:PAS domain-containing protein [Bacteroidota bacterium]
MILFEFFNKFTVNNKINKCIEKWDEGIYKSYGLEKNNIIKNHEKWINILHPDDHKNYYLKIQSILNEDKEYNLEFRIIRPNGNIKNIKSQVLYLNRKE